MMQTRTILLLLKTGSTTCVRGLETAESCCYQKQYHRNLHLYQQLRHHQRHQDLYEQARLQRSKHQQPLLRQHQHIRLKRKSLQ